MPTFTIETDARAVVEQELEALRKRIDANIRNAGKYVTGSMAQSMHSEVEESGSEVRGSLVASPFFGALETGSRPWRRQYLHPPKFFREIIAEWIDAKGLSLPAYPVARKIMREGSKLYREGGREDIFTAEIPIFSERVVKRLAGMVSVEISAPIQELTQKISDK